MEYPPAGVGGLRLAADWWRPWPRRA